MNVASSESSAKEDDGDLDTEIVDNLDNNPSQEIKIKEVIQEMPQQRIFKKRLQVFLEDNDEECLLEHKTHKKVKPNGINKDPIKGQPKIDSFFVKKTP